MTYFVIILLLASVAALYAGLRPSVKIGTPKKEPKFGFKDTYLTVAWALVLAGSIGYLTSQSWGSIVFRLGLFAMLLFILFMGSHRLKKLFPGNPDSQMKAEKGLMFRSFLITLGLMLILAASLVWALLVLTP